MSATGSYLDDRLANASGGRRAADRSHHAADPEQCARHFLRAARRVLPVDGDGLRPAEAVVIVQLTARRAIPPWLLLSSTFFGFYGLVVVVWYVPTSLTQ